MSQPADTSRETPGTSGHPRLVLTATILASSLAFIDGSVVNVALPAIEGALNGGALSLQWIINGYLLPLSALLLLGGALGDRFGRRRALIAGVGLFAVASGACALSPGLPWLLAGRIVQGVGAALLLPNSLAVLGDAFGGDGKGKAIGIWAAAGAGAGALGPVIGGWLVDAVGWRAIFLINLPLAAAAIGLALAFVHDQPSDKAARLDLPGAALAAGGLGAATWGLTLGAGPGGWTTPAVAGAGLGILLLIAFLAVERGKGDQAMMPLAMFASRGFIGLTLLTALVYGALGALLVLVPYVMIQGCGYSGTLAGAALLPFPLAVAVASPMMGALAGKIGPRMPLSVAPVVVAAGFLLAMRVGPQASYWTGFLPAILVISLGMSGVAAPLTTAVLNSVGAGHTGAASGLNSAVARTGGLIATALLGGVLAATGDDLFTGFRLVCAVCAAACMAAGACAFLLMPKAEPAASAH